VFSATAGWFSSGLGVLVRRVRPFGHAAAQLRSLCRGVGRFAEWAYINADEALARGMEIGGGLVRAA